MLRPEDRWLEHMVAEAVSLSPLHEQSRLLLGQRSDTRSDLRCGVEVNLGTPVSNGRVCMWLNTLILGEKYWARCFICEVPPLTALQTEFGALSRLHCESDPADHEPHVQLYPEAYQA